MPSCFRWYVASVLLWSAADLPAQTTEDARRRALRRTPVVDVYARCKDSVVFLTGPMVKADAPPTAEFFILPRKENENVVNVGSGFIVHADGYIVTNAHAVEKLIEPKVALSDGRRCPAELIAVVRRQDLALVKIDPPHALKPVELARSGDLMIGETVIVIGNPHGLLQTCTAGVLSAVGRSTRPSGLPGVTLRELIQTDASINAGSSGGPWFNALGEVIGVTVSRKADSENIAFAAPVATLRKELPAMLDAERRAGIFTGLTVSPGTPCRVSAVAAGSPAADAGLRSADVIAAVGRLPTPTGLDFHFALVGQRPGESLKVRILRGGRTYEAALRPVARAKPRGAALLKKRFGLGAVELDEAKAQAAALRVARGVVVTTVDAGLYDKVANPPLAGDVLGQFNGIRPRDLDHLALLIEQLPPGRPTKMVLLRLRDNVATRIDLTVTPRP